jgi:hypothetical protein
MNILFRAIFILVIYSNIGHPLTAQHNTDFYLTIAQEAFETELYQTAIDKCNEVLKRQKDNKDCIRITDESNEKLKKQTLAEKKAEEQRLKEEAIEKNRQEANSIASNICYTTGQIKETKKYIAAIQETGRRTGLVDKRALYSANLGLVSLEQQLQSQKGQYKKLTGKNFNNKCEN